MDETKTTTDTRLVWWPSPQDFNESVQTPDYSYSDQQLHDSIVELTALGLPRPLSGNFACVYKVNCAGTHYAVRCFLRNIPDHRHRYKHIASTISRLGLPEFVPFSYLDQGIRVHGQWFPILKMEWARGDSLIEYITRNLTTADVFDDLAQSVVQLNLDLRKHGIAHGDLQHGNILIHNDAIRLVDYDGMYVPAFVGLESHELGHRNYQHPSRTEKDFHARLDNFSAWLIYTSLIIISRDPTLWQRLNAGDDCLLFKKIDLQNPQTSKVFYILEHHADAEVRRHSRHLRGLLAQSLADMPFLDEEMREPEGLPEVVLPVERPLNNQPMVAEVTPEEAAFDWQPAPYASAQTGAPVRKQPLGSLGLEFGVCAVALLLVAGIAGVQVLKSRTQTSSEPAAALVGGSFEPTPNERAMIAEKRAEAIVKHDAIGRSVTVRNLYITAINERNPELAIPLYTQAIDQSKVPSGPGVEASNLIKCFFGRAKCYNEIDKPELAHADLEFAESTISRFYPDSASELQYVRNLIAETNVQLGRYDEAIGNYARVMESTQNPLQAAAEADSIVELLRNRFEKTRTVSSEAYRTFVDRCMRRELIKPAEDAVQSLNDAGMWLLDNGRRRDAKVVLELAQEIEAKTPEKLMGQRMQTQAVLQRLSSN